MSLIATLRGVLPESLLRALRPPYHFLVALLASIYYGYPSKQLVVVGVTGTKGKSSVTEMVGRIFEADGKKTAIVSTIHFSIGGVVERNLLKMTIPGRFLLQKLLRDAIDAGCTHAVVEMSSEGAVQFRQRFVAMDALIFTHLTPEHIESHGSLERYIAAKMRIGDTLVASPKRPRIIVANANDAVGKKFLKLPVESRIPFSIVDATEMRSSPTGSVFRFHDASYVLSLPGRFNIENAVAAISCATALNIPTESIRKGLAGMRTIPGRGEAIDQGQPFRTIVDYAHTAESLEAIYEAFPSPRVCILGNTGGGRDIWKRKVMGAVADRSCAHVILTDEDPYDEDPMAIVAMMKEGFARVIPEVVMDRKEAIRRGCKLAATLPGSTLLITGKGTDPFIMRENGTKVPWDDRTVAREVLTEEGYAPL